MKILVIAFLTAAILSGCSGNGTIYTATGTFDATEIIIAGEVPGRIIMLDPKEGDVVQAGDVIGVIDTIQIVLQKKALLENINAMRSQRPDIARQLAPYREKLDHEKREAARLAKLVRSDAATQKQLDDALSALDVAEKQLSAQETTLTSSLSALNSQIAAAQVQVEQIDDQLSRCRITSPISGTVIAKYAHMGELSAQGRPLMKIADTDNIFLKAYLTSAQLMDVKLGQSVKVNADFGGGNLRPYDGKVTWISDKSEFTPKNIVTSDDRANMVYATKISIINDGYIKIGMYGEVKLK